MDRGNVLVIGNSGVGKSTLINAVLGEEQAEIGWGTKGTTTELEIHESDKIPFRIIDTVGFEPTTLKALRAVNAVKKWSKNSIKEGHEDTQINVIWFCVEGTSSKLFPKTLRDLSRATSIWSSVPVIVVITKSYSLPDREQNIAMVNNAFMQYKRYGKNLYNVIPVVASPFILCDTAYAAPEGITELIDATNVLMPEGLRATSKDVAAFKLNRKRVMAHGLVGISTAGAVAIGAAPIPFADAAVLVPAEIAMISGLARVYEINSDEDSKLFVESIIKLGTASAVAKAAIGAISALKIIPKVNIGAGAVNAIVAGSIVAALGQTSIYIFEQVYLKNKSVTDINWINEVIELELIDKFPDVVKNIAEKANKDVNWKTLPKTITDAFRNSSKDDNVNNSTALLN